MAQDVKTADVETLPAIAAELREHIPQLVGRAIPVTEAYLGDKKDSVPELPIAIVAPLRQQFTHNGGPRMTVAEEFVIEIWLEPAMEKTKHGQTPFWSYYEYNKFRNDLFNHFAAWRTPQGGTLRFMSMDVESNFLATVLTFRLIATYDICREDNEWAEPAKITFDLCQPRSPACPPEPEQEKNPCPVST